MADTTLYNILGIPNGSGDTMIKRKYRELARQYHPDTRSKEVDQEEYDQTWLMIQKAYEILSNPDKKARYDLTIEILEENKKTIEENDDQTAPGVVFTGGYTSGSANSSMAYTSGSVSFYSSSYAPAYAAPPAPNYSVVGLSGYTSGSVGANLGITYTSGSTAVYSSSYTYAPSAPPAPNYSVVGLSGLATISFRVMNAVQQGLGGLISGQIVYVSNYQPLPSRYSAFAQMVTIHVTKPQYLSYVAGIIKHVAYGVAPGLQAYMDIEIEIL
jgi:hypothetical protein